MSFFRIRRIRRCIAIILVIAIIAVLTTIVINPMSTSLNIDALDKKIAITDYIALGALVATLIAGAFSLYYRNEQNDLLKIRREEDQLAIAKSQAESREASAKAEAAQVEQMKIEQKNIELSLELEKQKIAYLELYTAIAPRIIDPIKLAEKLKEQKGITVNLSSIGDPEAQQLASALEKAFRLAGWKIENRSLISAGQAVITPEGLKPMNGVVIQSSDSNLLTFLKASLDEYRIDCTIKVHAVRDAILNVFVGGKPNRLPTKK